MFDDCGYGVDMMRFVDVRCYGEVVFCIGDVIVEVKIGIVSFVVVGVGVFSLKVVEYVVGEGGGFGEVGFEVVFGDVDDGFFEVVDYGLVDEVDV